MWKKCKHFSSKEEDESLNRAEVDKSDQNDESQEMEEKANKLKKKRLIKCSGYFQVRELNKGTVLMVSS